MIEEVRLLAAGYSRHPEATTRLGAGWRPRRFPAGFALISHRERGAVLFDTGYSHQFHTETRAFPNRAYAWLTPHVLGERETAAYQLAALGIAPAEVRAVVVSHFHGDHIAGLRDFPHARIICSRAAWQAVHQARGVRALARGLLPGLLPPDAPQRLSFADDCATLPLPAAAAPLGQGRDLFGDGSALAIALPGHSVGQLGLFLPNLAGGLLFLVGDAAFSRTAIDEGVPPPRFTTGFLGRTDAYRTTLARLSALRHAAPDVLIVPSHAEEVVGMVLRG